MSLVKLLRDIGRATTLRVHQRGPPNETRPAADTAGSPGAAFRIVDRDDRRPCRDWPYWW
jgi:hypothetical protein